MPPHKSAAGETREIGVNGREVQHIHTARGEVVQSNARNIAPVPCWRQVEVCAIREPAKERLQRAVNSLEVEDSWGYLVEWRRARAWWHCRWHFWCW